MADLDAIRAAHLDGRPDSTHWGECHLAHPHCAIAVLLAEVERLQGQVDDLVVALDAEQDAVVRLADGIRRHRTCGSPDDATANRRLWALLDDRTETE